MEQKQLSEQMISVVIPMYNEADKVANTVETLRAYLEANFPSHELIMSNDGSTDGTAEIVAELARQYPHVRLVGHTPNQGKGAAVRDGMLAAKGDMVFFTDCDLAYGCNVLTEGAKKLFDSGCDVLIGSRAIHPKGYEGYTWLRKVVSRTYLKFVSLVCGFNHSDSQCGFKGFTGKAAKEIFAQCQVNGFAFDLEALMVAARLGYQVTELPVCIVNHDEGGSKVRILRDTVRMLRDVRGIKARLRSARK